MPIKHISIGLLFVSLLAAVSIGVQKPQVVFADEEKLDNVREEITRLEAKLDEIQAQKQSLSKTIDFIATKIKLTQSQINQTESQISSLTTEINELSGKIDVLDLNLEKISSVLINRISASYKSNFTQPIFLMLISNGFNDFFKQYKYLKASQQNDREVIFALEEARTNYDAQKQIKEVKQQEMEVLQNQLIGQRAELDTQEQQKQAALRVTQNDEQKYSAQLQKALSELEAIQSIIAGRGSETAVGPVSQGDRIAAVIPSSSACSNGAHLHFEVAKGNVHQNPANYLKNASIIWDNDPDAPFGFSGGWDWPISNPIRITQGFGMTFYAATLRYYGGAPHTGIDMISKSDYTVRAVQSGTLYRGGIACGGGTLRYVRVEQPDDISTYYLHVNY